MEKRKLVESGFITDDEHGLTGRRLSFWVTRDEQQIVCGTLSYSFTPSDYGDRLDLWLLIVDPIWRNLGIARRLMDHALSRNVLTTLLVDETNHAVDLYKSYGFTVTKRDEDTGGSPTLYMVRHVSEEEVCRP